MAILILQNLLNSRKNPSRSLKIPKKILNSKTFLKKIEILSHFLLYIFKKPFLKASSKFRKKSSAISFYFWYIFRKFSTILINSRKTDGWETDRNLEISFSKCALKKMGTCHSKLQPKQNFPSKKILILPSSYVCTIFCRLCQLDSIINQTFIILILKSLGEFSQNMCVLGTYIP